MRSLKLAHPSKTNNLDSSRIGQMASSDSSGIYAAVHPLLLKKVLKILKHRRLPNPGQISFLPSDAKVPLIQTNTRGCRRLSRRGKRKFNKDPDIYNNNSIPSRMNLESVIELVG